jgi:hypothetical protein
VLPFLGLAVDANLLNISAGGMAIVIHKLGGKNKINKGLKSKIHFRLPGRPLCECLGVITHRIELNESETFLGIRFTKVPASLVDAIHKMADDNERCDIRIRDQETPWCESQCSFYSLCRKPLRQLNSHSHRFPEFEIAFQDVEK